MSEMNEGTAPMKVKAGENESSLIFEFLDKVDISLNGFQIKISDLKFEEDSLFEERDAECTDIVFDVQFDEQDLIERVTKDLQTYVSDAIIKLIEKAVEAEKKEDQEEI
jgi:hypothetical protein